MLVVDKIVKVRKDNLYIICDGYNLKELYLDLHSEEVFIIVDFYKEDKVRFTKKYKMGSCGDCDVNKLIENLHIRIQNEPE